MSDERFTEARVNDMTADELSEKGFIPDSAIREHNGSYYTWIESPDGIRFHYWFTKKKAEKEGFEDIKEYINKFYEVFDVEPVFSEEHREEEKGNLNNDEGKQRTVSEEEDIPQIVRILDEVLGSTSGITPKLIERVLERVKKDPDFYQQNPIYLIRALTSAGLSWMRAMDVVDQTFQLLYKDSPEENPFIAMGYATKGGQMMYPPMMMYGPYRMQEREEEDTDAQLDKRLNRMIMNMMLLNMVKSMAPPQPQVPVQGNVIVEQEPVLDEEGKPVLDQNGQPVMRTRTIPVTASPPQAQTMTPKDVIDLVKAMKEEKGSDDIVMKFTEQLINLQKEVTQSLQSASREQIEMLKDRLEALESSDPLEQVRGIIETLKGMGLVGSPNTNTDIEKMKIDLQKWMHEQDMEYRKWRDENLMKMEDKKYARESMKELAKTTREAIAKVALPIAQSIGEGYREARKAPRPQGQPPQQQPQQQKRVEEMTNEELAKLMSEAEQAEAKVKEVKQMAMAELQRRGQSV